MSCSEHFLDRLDGADARPVGEKTNQTRQGEERYPDFDVDDHRTYTRIGDALDYTTYRCRDIRLGGYRPTTLTEQDLFRFLGDCWGGIDAGADLVRAGNGWSLFNCLEPAFKIGKIFKL